MHSLDLAKISNWHVDVFLLSCRCVHPTDADRYSRATDTVRHSRGTMATIARFVGVTVKVGVGQAGAAPHRASARRVGSVVSKTTSRANGVARLERNTSFQRGETCITHAKWSDEIKEEGADAAGASNASNDASSGLAFEPKSKSKRKRRDGSKTKRAKITVEGAAIEAARGEAVPTIQSASEEAYLLFLFGYVVVIFLGGLVLAGSAFKIFPDVVENWVTETLYPSYSPIVIGFLVFSSIYGLIKTRDDPNSAVGK